MVLSALPFIYINVLRYFFIVFKYGVHISDHTVAPRIITITESNKID